MHSRLSWFPFLACCLLSAGTVDVLAETPNNSRKVAWTQSRLVGSPEPPLPYVLEQAYPVEFVGPISLTRFPNSNQLVVCEHGGKIFSFDAGAESPSKKLVADLNLTPPPKSGVQSAGGRRIRLYSLTFHPEFEQSRFAYVCYVTSGANTPAETHIARFAVSDSDSPELVLESELDILTCEGGGHNGCTLAFGNDGYLYISIGDLAPPNPPDPRDTGQDISDLYASILRIDVDHRDGNKNYSIPPDNPFVHLSHARHEVYAYGLRNPFRMSFDPPTGDLWVGDVGWEAWEMVYRVRPGGNYGWAVKEGPGDVKHQPLGPTPILPADIALGHAEAASVTGGMVYRGAQYPDLTGTYIFGDWITRKYWAADFDAERVIGYREIATGPKPICFETDARGELLVLDYGEEKQAGGIFRFVPNPAASRWESVFPHRLSQTGLFSDTAAHRPALGVASYAINAPMWRDGATAEYLLAAPGSEQAVFYQRPQKTFDWFKTRVTLPCGSVLAKTYSIPSRSSQIPGRRIETQISLKDEQGAWQYYTYQWNDANTDALLVPAEGATELVTVPQANSDLEQTIRWQFASRTSCRICHTPCSGETVGLIEPQLRRPRADSDSWRRLLSEGLIHADTSPAPVPDAHYSGMVDPSAAGQPLDRRARSYLHANCAHCHIDGGNSSTAFEINFEKSLADTKLLGVAPMRGDLGLPNARIVSAGNPSQSVLLYRLAKAGTGRMPHIGVQGIDPLGMALAREWIAQLPQNPDHLRWLEAVCKPYLRPQGDGDRLEAARNLLDSTAGAMELAAALAGRRVPPKFVKPIVDEAMNRPVAVRDLFEAYAAPDQRTERLGATFSPSELLQREGDVAAGNQVFASGIGTCSGCHRIGSVGKDVGPDLSHIASKLKTKEKILRSLLAPSEEIEAPYRATNFLTEDGQTLVGRVIKRDARRLSLQTAGGEIKHLATDAIELEKPSPVSLMPEQLLAPLTAQQAADLLAYLASLK